MQLQFPYLQQSRIIICEKLDFLTLKKVEKIEVISLDHRFIESSTRCLQMTFVPLDEVLGQLFPHNALPYHKI